MSRFSIKLRSLILIFICGGMLLNAQDYRTLTSSDGRQIEATITDCDEAKVSIQLSNGQVFSNVPISRFSEDDQKYFRQWILDREAAKLDAHLTRESRIEVIIKRGRDDDLNESGDPDNREVRYDPEIIFENEETELSFKNVSGTIVFIGQSVLNSREYHLLNLQDFKVDLPVGERTTWIGKPFKNIYDDYAQNGSAFGAEYEGFLLILYDKNKKAQIIKSSKKNWEANYDFLIKADKNKGYTIDFSESGPKTIYRR